MQKEKSAVPEVMGEFSGARLKDARLGRRLDKLVQAVAAAPAKGFPQLLASEAELEAGYRFFGNERVDWREILEPHQAATTARCQAQKDPVVVAHDTTQFAFGGKSRAEAVGHLEHGHSG